MEVPVGLLAKLSNFLCFLPYFFSLLILANLKACVVAPLVVVVIGIGNSAVILGLWPAHLIWTYYCLIKTKRLGLVFKSLVVLCLPLPLLLWPVFGVVGSALGGAAYGYFAPLIATFEAVGENVSDKFYHCFMDGLWSTVEGSCTVVRDFTDILFHSYFSFMDELMTEIPSDTATIDIKLSRLPGSLLVTIVALPIDVLSITAVTMWKSPYMLFRGWRRLLEDLIGREGPFLESVCVPFAGLAILLWPAAVLGAVIAAFVSSFFLALYAGVVVHQEDSIEMGFAYIVAIISLFDEYANDLLYLREGSCVPRPRYRKHNPRREGAYDKEPADKRGSSSLKLLPQRSRTLKEKIQLYKPVQVLDWLFKSCEVEGRKLLRDGIIEVKDIEDCVAKGNCKKLGVALPAWCILKCLLASAKSESPGLVISEDVELVKSDWPREKVWQWFIEPLLIIKEQIGKLSLEESEVECLSQLIMKCSNEKPEDWDGNGNRFPSSDNIRKAQLQAIIRRLQGIVASMSRLPTFRRRFQDLVKELYLEAAKTGILANYVVEASRNQADEGGSSRDKHGLGSRNGSGEFDGENIV